ncbi:MAG: NAD-dependent epimerase/dehydratase [Gemmatimonadetes bacterium]|nr:NAD-dependent epimerase/dehydratase [Gemmatimonadota bacterium]
MTRALVTGGHGFVAQWAIRAMLERGWTVFAGGAGAPSTAGVLDEDQRAEATWLPLDVTRQEEVGAIVDRSRPDVVLHLAAVSHVPDALRNPGYAYDVNAVGTVRLLAEIRRHRAAGTADPVVLVIGSAEQYGRHELNAMPLHEEMEQRPLTLYAASKVAQEVAALQAFRSEGVRVVCTRSFSHSGVGHGSHFLLPSLVSRALALPKSGGRLAIGNGDTTRDFLHVSDVVTAYLALVQTGRVGEAYNVSSGTGVSVRALAHAVLQRVGVAAELVTDAALARPVDVPVQVGSNSKLRRATGWAPARTRDDIIDDLIHAATR